MISIGEVRPLESVHRTQRIKVYRKKLNRMQEKSPVFLPLAAESKVYLDQNRGLTQPCNLSKRHQDLTMQGKKDRTLSDSRIDYDQEIIFATTIS